MNPDAGISSVPTDETLMGRFRENGDPAAFQELITRNTRRFFRFAYSLLRQTRDAEDAVQECFLKILQARRKYKPGMRFSTWAFTILHHHCIDLIRGRKPSMSVELMGDAASLAEQELRHPVESAQERKFVLDALEALEEQERRAVVLRFYGELGFQEIAELLEITEDAAKKRVYRGLLSMKPMLDGRI
jgi:RNA polymerase sigma-70 factor, ECF subfamily